MNAEVASLSKNVRITPGPMLGMFALEVGVGVGEDMHPVVVPDDANVIARVTR